MPIIDIQQIPLFMQEEDTILGLDLGSKTIGVAVSDRSLFFANPRPLIRRKKLASDAKALLDLVRRENSSILVVGLPFNMNGSEGPRAQSVRAFVRNMQAFIKLPFVFMDERLSTVAAERMLVEMKVSRKKRYEKIDSAAASFILQGVLDYLNSSIYNGRTHVD